MCRARDAPNQVAEQQVTCPVCLYSCVIHSATCKFNCNVNYILLYYMFIREYELCLSAAHGNEARAARPLFVFEETDGKRGRLCSPLDLHT